MLILLNNQAPQPPFAQNLASRPDIYRLQLFQDLSIFAGIHANLACNFYIRSLGFGPSYPSESPILQDSSTMLQMNALRGVLPLWLSMLTRRASGIDIVTVIFLSFMIIK